MNYSFGIEIRSDGVHYAELEFKFFAAREVLKNNKETGEYHIKIKDHSNLMNAVSYFQNQFPGSEVGLVDPDGILNLEYPIYILIKERMVLANVTNIFHDIDKELSKKGG